MTKQATQYSVPTYDKPGALSKITDVLSRKGYNLAGITTETMGDVAYVRFIADNDAGVADTLRSAGYQVFETPVFWVYIANKPGELTRIAKKLGESNINIWHVYGTTDGHANCKMAFTVNNPEKAKAIFEQIGEKVTA